MMPAIQYMRPFLHKVQKEESKQYCEYKFSSEKACLDANNDNYHGSKSLPPSSHFSATASESLGNLWPR